MQAWRSLGTASSLVTQWLEGKIEALPKNECRFGKNDFQLLEKNNFRRKAGLPTLQMVGSNILLSGVVGECYLRDKPVTLSSKNAEFGRRMLVNALTAMVESLSLSGDKTPEHETQEELRKNVSDMRAFLAKYPAEIGTPGRWKSRVKALTKRIASLRDSSNEIAQNESWKVLVRELTELVAPLRDLSKKAPVKVQQDLVEALTAMLAPLSESTESSLAKPQPDTKQHRIIQGPTLLAHTEIVRFANRFIESHPQHVNSTNYIPASDLKLRQELSQYLEQRTKSQRLVLTELEQLLEEYVEETGFFERIYLEVEDGRQPLVHVGRPGSAHRRSELGRNTSDQPHSLSDDNYSYVMDVTIAARILTSEDSPSSAHFGESEGVITSPTTTGKARTARKAAHLRLRGTPLPSNAAVNLLALGNTATYVFILTALLFVLAWSAFKLWLIGPAETLRSRDIMHLFVGAPVALATIFIFAKGYDYKLDLDKKASQQLELRSERLHKDLKTVFEGTAGIATKAAACLKRTHDYAGGPFTGTITAAKHLCPDTGSAGTANKKLSENSLGVGFRPTVITEMDNSGVQVAKLSLSTKRPTALYAYPKRPYFKEALADQTRLFAQVIRSKTSGGKELMLSQGGDFASPLEGPSVHVGVFAIDPKKSPLAPLDFGPGYAIVSQTGEVRFHSSTNRQLVENFITSSKVPSRMLQSIRRPFPSAEPFEYYGQPHLAHVRPVVAVAGDKPLPQLVGEHGEEKWSVIAFESNEIRTGMVADAILLTSGWLLYLFFCVLGYRLIEAKVFGVGFDWIVPGESQGWQKRGLLFTVLAAVNVGLGLGLVPQGIEKLSSAELLVAGGALCIGMSALSEYLLDMRSTGLLKSGRTQAYYAAKATTIACTSVVLLLLTLPYLYSPQLELGVAGALIGGLVAGGLTFCISIFCQKKVGSLVKRGLSSCISVLRLKKVGSLVERGLSSCIAVLRLKRLKGRKMGGLPVFIMGLTYMTYVLSGVFLMVSLGSTLFETIAQRETTNYLQNVWSAPEPSMATETSPTKPWVDEMLPSLPETSSGSIQARSSAVETTPMSAQKTTNGAQGKSVPPPFTNGLFGTQSLLFFSVSGILLALLSRRAFGLGKVPTDRSASTKSSSRFEFTFRHSDTESEVEKFKSITQLPEQSVVRGLEEIFRKPDDVENTLMALERLASNNARIDLFVERDLVEALDEHAKLWKKDEEERNALVLKLKPMVKALETNERISVKSELTLRHRATLARLEDILGKSPESLPRRCVVTDTEAIIGNQAHARYALGLVLKLAQAKVYVELHVEHGLEVVHHEHSRLWGRSGEETGIFLELREVIEDLTASRYVKLVFTWPGQSGKPASTGSEHKTSTVAGNLPAPKKSPDRTSWEDSVTKDLQFMPCVARRIDFEAIEPEIGNDEFFGQVLQHAMPDFRQYWLTLTIRERLLLRNLAQEGLINPHAWQDAEILARSGVIAADGGLHIASDLFLAYVKYDAPDGDLRKLQIQHASSTWKKVSTVMLTLGLSGGVLLAIANPDFALTSLGPVLAGVLALGAGNSGNGAFAAAAQKMTGIAKA